MSKISGKISSLKTMGKNIDPSRPLDEQKNVTLIEYISLIIARTGGMFGTTLTGTLAATFLYEMYFGPVGVKTDQIAKISAVQTTITTILGMIMPLVAGIVVQKWKSHWGRYRQWYIICVIPIFLLTVSFYWVPKGWTVQQMAMLRYAIASLQTFFNAFNTLSQNIIHVITPNYKEKKTIATMWQIAYYLGYGLAYLSPEIYKLISDDKSKRYISLTLVAASMIFIGNLMCGIFCRERIELPKKPKNKLSKEILQLFKYRNYRAYHYFTWVANFTAIGKWSTLLAGITVGSSNVILLTVPSAAGTVIGNIICGKFASKFEPTKILKFCGVFTSISSCLLFFICYFEKVQGIYFWKGWTAAFFYAFYFLFGVGIGFQELSLSHYTTEFYDYLEWETGERVESIQGIIPGWINSGFNYIKEIFIPFILVWIAYPTSDTTEKELIEVIQERIAGGILSNDAYLTTCMWLVALLVFGYALSCILRALILKFFYDIEGDKKIKMYEELEEMRAQRHKENETTA